MNTDQSPSPELTSLEKYYLALGLVLAKDYLNLNPGPLTQLDILKLEAALVVKFDVESEHGRAAAETAPLGKVFRDSASRIREIINES